MIRKNTVNLVCFIFLMSSMSAKAMNALEIMERVDEQQRLANHQVLMRSNLQSCNFKVVNKKASCAENPRIKVVETASIQLGDQMKDSQGISFILEPAKEKGIGMLTYSYDDSTKNTESWLYLSALGKVKRMVSGSSAEQEPVAFFGSEFTTEDMENGKTNEYEYKILQEGPYSKTEVWVIEARPKPIRIPKTNYSKLYFWIDKKRFIPMKVQSYDKYEKLFKRIVFKNYEQINSHWIARITTLFNMKKQRLSTLKTEKISHGVTVDPGFLTQRSLTDFAFREANLNKLRKHFQ